MTKGHFEHEESTVILIGEKGKWQLRDDLIQKGLVGKEIFLKLGGPLRSYITARRLGRKKYIYTLRF